MQPTGKSAAQRPPELREETSETTVRRFSPFETPLRTAQDGWSSHSATQDTPSSVRSQADDSWSQLQSSSSPLQTSPLQAKDRHGSRPLLTDDLDMVQYINLSPFVTAPNTASGVEPEREVQQQQQHYYLYHQNTHLAYTPNTVPYVAHVSPQLLCVTLSDDGHASVGLHLPEKVQLPPIVPPPATPVVDLDSLHTSAEHFSAQRGSALKYIDPFLTTKANLQSRTDDDDDDQDERRWREYEVHHGPSHISHLPLAGLKRAIGLE